MNAPHKPELAHWRHWVQQLKGETYALYLAYRDPRVPWYARLWLALVVGYAFSPIDLIPDFIPVLGYVDDLVLIPLGVYLAIRLIPPDVMADCRAEAQRDLALGKPVSRVAAVVIFCLWLLSIALVISLLLSACNQAVPAATRTAAPTAAAAAPTETSPVAPSDAPAAPVEPDPTRPLPLFEPGECRFRQPAWPDLECGDLLVPENRQVADSPVIRLHVAILRSSAGEPQPDPLIYLSGGPGSFELEWLQWEVDDFRSILERRDVLFFDQRGIGYSEPSMDCPEVDEEQARILRAGEPAAAWMSGRLDAYQACLARLREQGIDLAAYNSAASAADVDDLRQALGYDQVNLYGISYGTRLALTIMRDYPEIVRSAILDSPVPLQIHLLASQGPTSQAALDLVFERCAADQACAAAYPDLEGALDELLARLDGEPVEVQVSHLIHRKLSPVLVNGDLFMSALFFSLYDPGEIYRLPGIIYDSYQETPSYRNRLAEFMQVPQIQGEFSSEGNRYSVLCREEVPFLDQEEALAEYAGMHPGLRSFLEHDARTEFAICDAWGVGRAAAVENEAVVSDIPALVLTGEFDPVTPPALGDLVVETLANGVHVSFPFTSHGVFSERGCARQIAAAFLDDPAAELDLDCMDALLRQPPEFEIR